MSSGEAVKNDDVVDNVDGSKVPPRASFEENPDDINAKWKGDPKDTWSDWTIEIVTTKDGDNEVVETYNVHKFFS